VYDTYVLQGEKDSGFYVGFTQNLKLRFDRNHSFCFCYNRLRSYLTG